MMFIMDIDIIINIIIKIKPEANYNDVVRGVWVWDDKISYRKIRNRIEFLKIKLTPFSCEHRGDVKSIIDGCYVPDMSSDELIKEVWEKDDTVKVGTIARHFYRVQSQNKKSSSEIPEKPAKTELIPEIPEKPVDIKLPQYFSYEKRKLFDDMLKYGVKLVYKNFHRYGFGRDEIEAINDINDREVIKISF